MQCATCEFFEYIPSKLFITPYPYCNYHGVDLVDGPNEVNPNYHVCENYQESEVDCDLEYL